MNRRRHASNLFRSAAATIAVFSLASCGLLGSTDTSSSAPPSTLASLGGPPTSALWGSAPPPTSALAGGDAPSEDPSATVVDWQSVPAAPAPQVPPTDVIGFDVLAEATIADAEQIGALAYGIEAAADPYRITISPPEEACLTKASSGLTDDQIDDALAWDETSGDFGAPVAACLSPENREAFAVWHRIDTDLADATDRQFRCVEQGVASGATHQHLDAALTSCGVTG